MNKTQETEPSSAVDKHVTALSEGKVVVVDHETLEDEYLENT